MSDISISIPSEPFRNMIKAIIAEEQQPTLYGNDNTLAGVIHEEIEASPRVQEHLKSVVVNTVLSSSAIEDFINDSLSRASENSPRFRRAIEEAVSEAVDYSEIASNIEVCDLADHISASDIAEAVSVRDIAGEVCMDTLSKSIVDHGLDYSKLARALLREIRAEAKSST